MPFNLNWNTYPEGYIYTTNKGIKWVRYPFHYRKMYKAYPEELVRLQTVDFLFKEMKVPYLEGALAVEVKMSAFGLNHKGRVDIVVHAQEEDNIVPVLIVECKASHIPLTKDVLEQATRYDELLLSDTIMITNGKQMALYKWDKTKKNYVECNKIPTYQELVEQEKLRPFTGLYY